MNEEEDTCIMNEHCIARANVSHTHGLIHEDEDGLKKILLVYTHMTLHVL